MPNTFLLLLTSLYSCSALQCSVFSLNEKQTGWIFFPFRIRCSVFDVQYIGKCIFNVYNLAVYTYQKSNAHVHRFPTVNEWTSNQHQTERTERGEFTIHIQCECLPKRCILFTFAHHLCVHQILLYLEGFVIWQLLYETKLNWDAVQSSKWTFLSS